MSVACNVCGTPISEPASTPPDERRPCPNCGSTARAISVWAGDALELRDSIRVKHKRRGFKGKNSGKSKGGLMTDQEVGWQKSADGTWVHKVSVFDRINDRRYELVTTEDGTVLHEQDHQLTQHVGHGSDKPRTPPSDDLKARA